MKKIFFIFISLFIFSSTVSAQYADVSMFLRSTSSHKTINVIPWVVWEPGSNGFLVQGRFNFDAQDALSLFIGKNISLWNGVNITPQIGYIYSKEYKAVTQELWITHMNSLFSVFVLNQISAGTGLNHNDFIYHWTEILFPINPGISVGISEQVFTFLHVSEIYFDIGPTVKVLISDRFYLKPWITYDFTYEETKGFLGIGYIF